MVVMRKKSHKLNLILSSLDSIVKLKLAERQIRKTGFVSACYMFVK
jgi:hypothetical protein